MCQTRQFSRLLPHRFGLPSVKKNVRDEGGKLFCCFQVKISNPKSKIEVAGVFRFELKTSVLETGVLPVETTRLCKLGVSDGSRTRSRRFGRPALSQLSFAHKFVCIGKDLNFHSANARQFYRLLALTNGDRCVKNKKFCVKMKKAEQLTDCGRSYAPNKVTRFFSRRNSPKF